MPVQVSYPGVYIEEVPSGVRTITGVSTSIAAFVGFFPKGPMNKAEAIFNMGDFERIFGGLDKRSDSGYAISQFFLNGGQRAYVVRVASGDDDNAPQQASVAVKSHPAAGSAPKKVLTIKARNEGVWGNHLRAEITHNVEPAETFNLIVHQFDGMGGTARLLTSEAYRNLSVAKEESRYFVDVVNEESNLIEAEHDENADNKLPAATGTLGKQADLESAAAIHGLKNKSFNINIGGTDKAAALTWKTQDQPDNLVKLRAHVEKAIRDAEPKDPLDFAYAGATVELFNNRFLIRTGRARKEYEPLEIADIENEAGDDTATKLGFSGSGKSENVQEYIIGSDQNVGSQEKGKVGRDGIEPNADAINGSRVQKTGMFALENVDIFNILCIPCAADLKGVEKDKRDSQRTTIISAAVKYCEERRAFMIIDIPETVDAIQEMKDWMDENSSFRNKNAAVYFPRIYIPDPKNEYRPRSVGASGTMAGIYARTDSSRGVWKAPAGIEATLSGVSKTDVVVTDVQNGVLNPLGINCLRNFSIYGNVSWGARTLNGADQMASEWKYIPVRRLALFLEESLYRGLKWVVFEPNDEPLWSQIRLNVGAFMHNLFRQAAFEGKTPKDAYFVKCDNETTTPNDQNLGIVNIHVGFAPLKPAEFVIIKIQQKAQELQT